MIASMFVPALRIRNINSAPVRPDGAFVLYWMTAARRTHWNFALDRAVEVAKELGRPLVVLEALRCGHRWASDRTHRFVLDGMVDNERACEVAGTAYFPYVEPADGAGKGLLAALAGHACSVVTDDFPCFFLPRMVASAGRQLAVRLEAVDSNGLLPLRATGRVFDRAVDFRRFLQRELPRHLRDRPRTHPLTTSLPRLEELPAEVLRRWPRAEAELLGGRAPLSSLPIDHAVAPVPFEGGEKAAALTLARFVKDRLPLYAERRNEPGLEATSGLSPFLHFGHVSAHQVLDLLARAERWSTDREFPKPSGKREGWWGMSPAAEAFVDQLVTWRELGLNYASLRDDTADYASLPAWARATLDAHRNDPRSHRYSFDQLERAATHDEIWNAAQRQLRLEGRIHNYLRMLWAKNVLQWSASPEEAAATLVALNDRWAVDGRDPNSYSGIFWTFGRYDRPWPERPVLGTIRAMTSESTRRKLDLGPYLERFSGQATLPLA